MKLFICILIMGFTSFSMAQTPEKKPLGIKEKIEHFMAKASHQLEVLWDKINVVGKFEKFGKKMKKQNDTVVENAAAGIHTQVAKRAVSSNEKINAIQQNMDKATAEKLKKYNTVE